MNEYNVINTSQKKSNWNANEGEAGYIKNRTHYIETGNSITGTFTLSQEDIENGSAYIENSDLAEDAVDTLGDISSINIDIIINNQTYKANIQAYIGGIGIQSSLDNSFNFDFHSDEYGYVANISFDSSIFVVGENTITIPIDTFHKINPNYIEDTLLWQKGSANSAVQSLSCKAISDFSHAEGCNTTSTGRSSHAEGVSTMASGANSHVEGSNTQASGVSSHAEGDSTTASGRYSHAEGSATASGNYSHAEGYHTKASGNYSHAEGNDTTASGNDSHSEGLNTRASEVGSHSEGISTTASGKDSHAEGFMTIANHHAQHVFGEFNIADPSTNAADVRGNYVEIVGNGRNDRNYSNARTLDWNGNEVLSGKLTVGTQPTNDNDVATKKYVDDHNLNNAKDAENGGIIEGLINGNAGQVNVASGLNAHAEGGITLTDEDSGQTICLISTASGDTSHAEGIRTTASGTSSHAEGSGTTASGDYSHTEGSNTTASGEASHAEGGGTTASEAYSHAEGSSTTASGMSSHAEGGATIASGGSSHAEGWFTIANHRSQHVFGEYNIADPSSADSYHCGNYIEIVGNGGDGTHGKDRSNARTLDWSGNEWLAGKMTADLGIVLKSPDGSSYTLTMNNDGTLKITKNT